MLGLSVPFLQHPTAVVESQAIGHGTEIAAFARILAGARIGAGCRIGEHTLVETGAVVGDRVTLRPGVRLWDGVVLEDDVFVGPNATISDERRLPGARPPVTTIRRGASVGANATILAGLTIDEDVVVEPGAVVTRNVPRNAMVTGNPARIVGYAGARIPDPPPHAVTATGRDTGSLVGGVVLYRLPLVSDLRGMLSFAESGREVPFAVRRYFVVFDVDTEQVRGEHAHRTLHQFLVCVHGRCSVMADDGRHRQEFLLDSPDVGIYIPPMTWAVQYKYSRDGVLLALVSDVYDPDDYIRDYGEFLALRRP